MQFDPGSALFWNEVDLEKELYRAAELCNGCRLCFNLCPSFPELFDRIDSADGDVAVLSPSDLRTVVDLCFQCKLCYVKCPYTPPHEFDLDFPRLMLRAKAIRARAEGLTLQARFLGNTDLVGALGSFSAPLANWANQNRLGRAVMERVIGIHHDRKLPQYHRQSFISWFRKRPVPRSTAANGKVALFFTCYVNFNQPEVGRAAVQVLEHNGIDVVCPDQKCCGMPHLDVGDIARATKSAAANTSSLLQYVELGYHVVVLGPTCSYMLKQEYPRLVADDGQKLASHTLDISEYLVRLHHEGRLATDFHNGLGRVAYHHPCHLRAQNVGHKSRDLLQLLPDTSVQSIERCCGVDGTWGMRKEYHELSLKVGAPLFNAIRNAQADKTATDCPLAAMQIAQGANIEAFHPVVLLRDAYGLPAE